MEVLLGSLGIASVLLAMGIMVWVVDDGQAKLVRAWKNKKEDE